MQTAASNPTAADVDLTDVAGLVELVRTSVGDLVAAFVEQLPLLAVGLVVFLLGLVVVRFLLRAVDRSMQHVDDTVRRLTLTFVQVAAVLAVAMLGLSVAGIDVGAALAALGLLGLAFAFAFQNILENFIAGILILLRRPFRVGDQIIAIDKEGTVIDVNMRITKLRTYDGVHCLLPNADVFRGVVVNLTEAGRRRTAVAFGVDYRDDHDLVAAVVGPAVRAVDGVLADPAADVLCVGLGDSSVDFEVRFWTAPERSEVTRVRDAVVRATKTAVEGAGMSIPWPIRTLEPGEALQVEVDRPASPAA